MKSKVKFKGFDCWQLRERFSHMIIGPQHRFPRFAVKQLCNVDFSVVTHFAPRDKQSTIYENTILRDSSVNSGTYDPSTGSLLYNLKASIRYLPSFTKINWSSAVIGVEQGYAYCYKDILNFELG